MHCERTSSATLVQLRVDLIESCADRWQHLTQATLFLLCAARCECDVRWLVVWVRKSTLFFSSFERTTVLRLTVVQLRRIDIEFGSGVLIADYRYRSIGESYVF